MSEQLQLRRGTATQVAAFTGAQGELAVDTTNNILRVNDGATQGGWPLALATRAAVADVAYAAVVTDRLIAYTSLTAARIVTLPAASAFPVGAILVIMDESGNCSATKTITAARAGSDTINGGASAVISAANGVLALESNGSGAWTIVHSRAPSTARTPVSDAAYAALATDRMIAYTALTAARVVTLPAAAAYPTGTLLIILDESGSCSPTLTITASRAGSDTISGATSAVIAAAYGSLILESNGSSAWTVVDVNSPAATRGSTYALGQSHLPFILCSSGTMGANGALSGLTALPTTYPAAYIYLPSGAISAGSAAGWYYFVGSSTTAGTVYNNTYSSGTPTIPGSPTAFSTTGPGAFTQTTASFITAYSLSIAGNTIGVDGAVRINNIASYSSSTNAKTIRGAYGSAPYVFATLANAVSGDVAAATLNWGFANRQATNVQQPLSPGPSGLSSTALSYGAIDTTATQTLAIGLELATATDFIVLEGVEVELIPGVT